MKYRVKSLLYCALVVLTRCLDPVTAFAAPRQSFSCPGKHVSTRTRLPGSTSISYTSPLDGRYRNTVRSRTSSSQLHLSFTVSSVLGSLKAYHVDPFYCLTGLFLLSTFGITLEKRTTVGKALSAPLATMALALALANVGVLPFESVVYNTVNAYFIPLAVPMLLFDSDLKRVLSDTGSLLAAFAIGALATVIGTIVAFPLLPMKSLGKYNWKIACALAARHIGGAINFVAVSETLNIAGTVVSAAIAADNVVVALYFAMLFAISEPGKDSSAPSVEAMAIDTSGSEIEYSTTLDTDASSEISSSISVVGKPPPKASPITLASLSLAVSVASLLVTVGKALTTYVLPKGTSALPVTSLLTVFAATVFPSFFVKLRPSGTALGVLFIQMFFAASGASGSIKSVIEQAPSLFAFSALQIAVHFAVLMIVGKFVFKLRNRELYLASNANVGGPTTAAAMAQAKNWNKLVLPALLVGILGYATATGIALALGPIIQRLPILAK